MKALVYTGVEELTYQDRAKPKPANGEHLVRILASGICGSDMHAFLGHDARRPAPLTLGHEASGVVEGGPMDGQKVTINPLVVSPDSEYALAGKENLCPDRQIISMPPREGAFAEYVCLPERNLLTVPEDVPFEKAALVEPIACGWHAVRLARAALGGDLIGRKCAVLGGGAIGVGAALSLRAQGARDIVVVETNALRRKTLNTLDGFRTVGLEDANTPTGGSIDCVVDAVGYSATRAHACALAAPGGVIAHIGLGEATGGLDVRRMTLQEITFIGTYTYTYQDFHDTAQAIFDGSLGPLNWVETRPLADGQSAFKNIFSGNTAAPKVMLIPEHAD